MQLPFLDMLWTIPASLSLPHHAACWYCQPMSLWSTGVAPSGIFASNWSSRASCCAMSGLVDVDHATISLLPKSYTGAK